MAAQVIDQAQITHEEAREKFVEYLAKDQHEEAMRYLMLCPIDAGLALAIKRVSGMDMLEGFDLSEAKKVYPYEFA